MYILSGLPARGATDPNLTKAVYLKALEGVTRHSLEVAADKIIMGHSGLEHGFMPSPPELRRECERVMKPITDSELYVREVERGRKEAFRLKKQNTKTDHKKGRTILAKNIDHGTWVSSGKRDYPVGSLWCAKTGAVYSPKPTVVPQAAARDRFADIPDQPITNTFKQVGTA